MSQIPPPLRVIAAPGHLVADDKAYQAGNRFRFVGRSPTRAKDIPPGASLEAMYPPEARDVPDDHEHRYVLRHLQRGALLPADEHTAKRAGVPFVPSPKKSAPAEPSARKG